MRSGAFLLPFGTFAARYAGLLINRGTGSSFGYPVLFMGKYMRNKLAFFALLLSHLGHPALAQQATESAKTAEWKYQTKKLDRAQVDGYLATPDRIVVIDVRRPDELARNGGLPVYLSIPAGELEKFLAYIPRERLVLTASNHAGRAGAAADLLLARGFNVAGAVGVQNYEEQGGKLFKPRPPAPRDAAETAR